MDGDDNDKLGSIAEDLFRAMGKKADLYISSPAPDRTGKDFLIEERIAPLTGVASFDKRPGPRICVAQLKATQSKRPKVNISLVTAERLTKDPNAAVLAVLQLDESYECVEAYWTCPSNVERHCLSMTPGFRIGPG